MAEMDNPLHPGLTLRDEGLPELGLSVTEAADQLGVSRVTLSRVINGRAAISAEMALRLANGWAMVPEIWLRMQVAYDLCHARLRLKKLKIKPAVAPAHAAWTAAASTWRTTGTAAKRPKTAATEFVAAVAALAREWVVGPE